MRQLNELVSGPQLVFESSVPAIPNLTASQAVIYRNNPSTPIILSGLPAYQGAAFSMPIDARPTSGYLQIDATFQVLRGVEGVLRISINNIRRGEMLLHPGEAGRSMQISLTSEELTREQLVVSFSLLGEGPNAGCVSEAGIETVTEIETTSALYLTLDRPLETTRDRVISWGSTVHVGWPEWLASDERPRRLALAAKIARAGRDVIFLDGQQTEALTTDELRELTASLHDDPQLPPTNWPLAIAETGANAGVRRFNLKTSWRTRYDLSDFTGLEMPTEMDLFLLLGPHQDVTNWTVTTTLNGRIVQMDTVGNEQSEFTTQVLLPETSHELVNVIEVTASTSLNPEGICNSGPELIAEMRPDTILIGGGATFSTPLEILRSKIAVHANIGISGDLTLSAPEATMVAKLIAAIVPNSTEVQPINLYLTIRPLGRASTAALSQETERMQPTWIVYSDTDTQKIMVELLTPEVSAQLSHSAPTALLIEFPVDVAQEVTR
jgi:hypothetical protein